MISVYIGTDTEETFNVVQSGSPYDLDNKSITKVEVYVTNGMSQLTAESGRFISSDNGDITWTADVLTLKLGHLKLITGSYKGKVKFYNAANPLGFVIQELPLKVIS